MFCLPVGIEDGSGLAFEISGEDDVGGVGHVDERAGDATPQWPAVRARIDEKTKEEAAAVLDAIGLAVSDAFRLMMVRIATEKRLPFEPLVPNPETIATLEAARRGDLGAVGDVNGQIADLHADDWADRGLQERLPAREERSLRQDYRCRTGTCRDRFGRGPVAGTAPSGPRA